MPRMILLAYWLKGSFRVFHLLPGNFIFLFFKEPLVEPLSLRDDIRSHAFLVLNHPPLLHSVDDPHVEFSFERPLSR